MKCEVNTKLVPSKVTFFGVMSASALLFPFMILFFKQQLGLTTTECAVIYGCLPLFSAFFNLLIGAIADKFQIHKVLTLVFCILSAVLLNCLLFVPPKEGTTNIEPKGDTTHFVTCIQHSNASIQCTMINDKDTINGNSNMSHRQDLKSNYSLKDCGSVWNISSEAICSQHTSFRQTIPVETTNLMEVQKCKVNCLLTQDNLKATTFGQTFWISFFLYFTSASIFNAIWVVLYGMLFAILGDNRNDFGKTRIWASIGGLLTSVIVAFTMNRYGSSSSDMSFIPCFIGYGVGLLLAGVASMFFKLPQIPSNPAMIKDIIKLFRQPRIALLFTVVFILGFLHGGVEIFLFVFLRELDASSWALGGCFFARFLGEIVAMYHSGMVIERVGHIRCIYMFLAFLCLRCLGTSLIPNPWWELPLSFTRSIAYSIGYAALSVYGSLVTPPSMHATLQGVILTVYYGFGWGFGTLSYGPMISAIGTRWSFRVAAIIAMATYISYMLIQQFLPPVKLVTHEDGDDDVIRKLKTSPAEEEKFQNTSTKLETKCFKESDETKLN